MMKMYMNRPMRQISSWERLPLLLTIEDVAVILQIPQDAVRRLIRAGRLPAARIDERQYRVTKAQLKKYVNELEIA